LPWVRNFFLPIARETRGVLLATPFRQLPAIGDGMLDRVDWAWSRLLGSIKSATGQEWAEDSTMTDSDNQASDSVDEDPYEQLQRRFTVTPEEHEEIREKMRREREEWVRQFWGDQKPFPIPDTDTDA
jgi:hypothetical protein